VRNIDTYRQRKESAEVYRKRLDSSLVFSVKSLDRWLVADTYALALMSIEPESRDCLCDIIEKTVPKARMFPAQQTANIVYGIAQITGNPEVVISALEKIPCLTKGRFQDLGEEVRRVVLMGQWAGDIETIFPRMKFEQFSPEEQYMQERERLISILGGL